MVAASKSPAPRKSHFCMGVVGKIVTALSGPYVGRRGTGGKPVGRFKGNRHQPSPALAAALRPLKKHLPQAGWSRNNTKNPTTLSRGIRNHPQASPPAKPAGPRQPEQWLFPSKNTHIRIFIRNGHCYFSPFAVYRAAYNRQRPSSPRRVPETPPMFIAPKEPS